MQYTPSVWKKKKLNLSNGIREGFMPEIYLKCALRARQISVEGYGEEMTANSFSKSEKL